MAKTKKTDIATTNEEASKRQLKLYKELRETEE
jgi:hypothetical protein